MADFTRNTDGEEVKNFITNTATNETGCIPNALIAKAMRMSMENKNVLLPEKPYTNISNGVDVALAGSLYYANGLYNAVKGTDDTVAYYVPQTTRVEVDGTIASGSVLTFQRKGSNVSLAWSASTSGVTISFDTTKYESSVTDTSAIYGKWISKSLDSAGSTWPALYRMNLNLTSLSGQIITLPQLLVQLYETTAAGAYSAVSCSMVIQKTGEEVVLSLYSNKIWAGIASILQTGQVFSASGQQSQN